MIVKLLTLVIILISTSAYGAVNSNHPRVWLDTTRVTHLKTLVSVADGGTGGSNSQEWSGLKTYCTTHIAGTTSSGYRGLDWFNITVSLSLAYAITDDETYAEAAVKYLDALLDDSLAVGDGLGHVQTGDGYYKIGGDSNGWTARTFGSGIALARDWLDGSVHLTTALEEKASLRAGEWFDYFMNDPSSYTGVSSADGELQADNFYAGNFAMVYLAAISFSGDANYDSAWMTKVEEMWSTRVNPLIDSELDGGDWTEGWSYGAWSSREYMQYLRALETGTDTATPWSETDWYANLVYSHLHMLYPSRDFFCDDGSQSGSVYGRVDDATVRFLIADTPITAEEKGLAQWYLDNTVPTSELWERFLWQTDTVAVTPSSSDMTLLYDMAGHHVMMRGDYWDSTVATIIDFIAKTDTNTTVSEGDRNAGMIKIGSRGEELLIDGDTTSTSSDFENVPMVTGSHTYAPYQEWWHYTSILSNNGEGVGYAKTVDNHSAYDGKDDRYEYPNLSPSLSFYEREVVFFHPDTIVVFDNIQATSTSNVVSFRWNFANSPTVNGNVVIGTVGTARLFLTQMGQSGAFAVPFDNQEGSTRTNDAYAVDFNVSGTPLNNQSIHLFETTDSSQGSETTSMYINNGSVKGVHTADNVAIFNPSTSGVPFSSSFDYPVTTSEATKHVISGLKSSTNYTVGSSGATSKTVSISEGVGGTSTNSGVISFTVATDNTISYVAMGDSPIVPVCDAGHLNLCTDQSSCETATGNWCTDVCQAEECSVEPPAFTGSTFQGTGSTFIGTGTIGAN